jgi:hypothetical protein
LKETTLTNIKEKRKEKQTRKQPKQLQPIRNKRKECVFGPVNHERPNCCLKKLLHFPQVGSSFLNSQQFLVVQNALCYENDVTPGFKVKLDAHGICAQGSSLHTYRKENGYRITNITIYNNYYQIMSYKRLSQTLSEAKQ